MKKFVVFFLLNFVHFLTFSQEHQFLNNKETLADNKVYRMDEYDALDSVGFKRQFPNGYFSMYNEDGLVIKANNYYSYDFAGEEPKHDEYFNFYLYDENDHRIGFIQQFTEGEEPFRMVALEAISDDQQTIQFATVTPSFVGYEVKFKETNYNPAQRAVGDTIEITKTHHHAVGVFDSSFVLDIFYSNTTGLIDSTIYHNKCLGKVRSEKCQSKTFFVYDTNGKLTAKRFENHSNSSDINPYTIRTVTYNKMGLVDMVETNHLDPNVHPKKELRKFSYTFRKND